MDKEIEPKLMIFEKKTNKIIPKLLTHSHKIS